MTATDEIILSLRERRTVHRVLAPFADRVDNVMVFGSRVLGRARPESDIDLVLHGTLDDRDVARIWTLFQESSLPVAVDVARYGALGASSFRRHIDRYAKLLFTSDDLRDIALGRAA